MSITGSIVIAVVLLARLTLKRAPKLYFYALRAVLLFRLLCPLSITAGLSVLRPLPVTTTPGISSVSYQPVQEAEQPKQGVSPAYLWLAGASLMALYSVAQYLVLRRRLGEAVPLQGKNYLADRIFSASKIPANHVCSLDSGRCDTRLQLTITREAPPVVQV